MSNAQESGAKINPGFKQAVMEALGRLPAGVERFQVMVGTPPDEFNENTYVVYDEATRDALIIDPGARDPRIETFIRTPGLKVKKILNTHGHSPGSVCYLINGHLFSGDVLFKNGVGRTWGQNKAEEKEKMAQQTSHIKTRLLVLPTAARVFPGHGPDTTIGREKENNFLL